MTDKKTTKKKTSATAGQIKDLQRRVFDLEERANMPGIETGYDTTLNLFQRLRLVKQDMPAITPKDTGKGYLAPVHADVVRAAKRLFIKYGLEFSLCQMDDVDSHFVEVTAQDGGTYQKWVRRYSLTHVLTNVDTPTDNRVVQVIVEATGDSKGWASATTLGEKFALLRLLGVDYGQDPEFDEAQPTETMDPQAQALAARIRKLAVGRDDGEVERVMQALRNQNTRSAETWPRPESLPIEILEQWVAKWQSEAPEQNGTMVPAEAPVTSLANVQLPEPQVVMDPDPFEELCRVAMATLDLAHENVPVRLSNAVMVWLHGQGHSAQDLHDTEVMEVVSARALEVEPSEWRKLANEVASK